MPIESLVLNFLDSTHFIYLLIGAFGAGALTSIAPCSLLSVPLLVSSAIGLGKEIPEDKKARFTLIFSALFAFGVMISFSILAYLVAKLGLFFSIAPLWAYALAGILALGFGFYSLGLLGQMDKNRLFFALLRFRFFGIFIIGIIFGLVSTPCASAPLVAIVSLASSLGSVEAYILVLVFALGHSLLLLIAGASVSFTQKIVSNHYLSMFSTLLTKFFAYVLILIAMYLFYKGWLVL